MSVHETTGRRYWRSVTSNESAREMPSKPHKPGTRLPDYGYHHQMVRRLWKPSASKPAMSSARDAEDSFVRANRGTSTIPTTGAATAVHPTPSATAAPPGELWSSVDRGSGDDRRHRCVLWPVNPTFRARCAPGCSGQPQPLFPSARGPAASADVVLPFLTAPVVRSVAERRRMTSICNTQQTKVSTTMTTTYAVVPLDEALAALDTLEAVANPRSAPRRWPSSSPGTPARP